MFVIASMLSLALIAPSQQSSAAQQPQAGPAAAAQPRTAPATAGAEASSEDPNRQICRREAAAVGSNRPRRVCAPAWQWEQAREESRDMMRRNANGQSIAGGATEGGDAPTGRGF